MHHRKGCLKIPSPMPSPVLPRKCVVFCGNEDVHIADEWDRTPTEPAPKLSYQEMLEFNAIQRSLPHANQLPDPFTGKPARQYLSTVPVGLLPLLNDESKSPPPSSPSPSPFSAEKPVLSPPMSPPTFPPTSPPVKLRPKFAFLPLLDTPTPPAPPEPEPKPKKEDSSFPLSIALQKLKLEAVPSPVLTPPSPLSLATTPKLGNRASYFDNDVLGATPGLGRKKRKSIIVINDMEIEVDDDEEDEEDQEETPVSIPTSGTSAISIPPKPTSSPNTLSSSVSSTTSHSHTDYDFDHDEGGVGIQTLHSPLASPVSSIGEGEDKWGSPSTSPLALSPLKVTTSPTQNRVGCSPKRRRRGGGALGGSPLLVPSA